MADMQNESDALHILALASGQAGNPPAARSTIPASRPTRDKKNPTPDLDDFALIKLGIVNKNQVAGLTETFFRYHHPFYVSFAYRTHTHTDSQWCPPRSCRVLLHSSRSLRKTRGTF